MQETGLLSWRPAVSADGLLGDDAGGWLSQGTGLSQGTMQATAILAVCPEAIVTVRCWEHGRSCSRPLISLPPAPMTAPLLTCMTEGERPDT